MPEICRLLQLVVLILDFNVFLPRLQIKNITIIKIFLRVYMTRSILAFTLIHSPFAGI